MMVQQRYLRILALLVAACLVQAIGPQRIASILGFFRGGASSPAQIGNNDRWSLSGKKIIVTGGTLGIGKSIVEECAALGAEVITCARNEETLRNCLDEWASKGFSVYGCVADVSTEEGRGELLDLIERTRKDEEGYGHGHIDALINNVGTNVRKKAIDYTEEEYEKIMNTNLKSAFHLTRSCYPFLKKRGKGSAVVNIGSVAGTISSIFFFAMITF